MWGVDNWLHWYASRMWNLCAPKRRHEVGLFACQLWNDRNGDLAIPSDSSPLLTALDLLSDAFMVCFLETTHE